MAFDQSLVTDVVPTIVGAELAVSWSSTAPAGTVYQVYLDRELAWSGTATRCVVPYPSGRVRIDVGAVLAAEAQTSFAASLPSIPGGGQRISITWIGGSYLGLTLEGFHIYMGSAPGGAVNYSRIVDTVAAYAGGNMSGFGMGGFGVGGFGLAASNYSWTSRPLARGVWNLAVVPFDLAGNEGTPQTTTVTLAGPPGPPARGSNGRRVSYVLNQGVAGGFGSGGFGEGGYGTGAGFGVGGFGLGGFGVGAGAGSPYVTVNWNASPG